jgi:hypothetical protein
LLFDNIEVTKANLNKVMLTMKEFADSFMVFYLGLLLQSLIYQVLNQLLNSGVILSTEDLKPSV